MTFGERLKLIINELDMTPSGFYTGMGYENNSPIYQYLKGPTIPTYEFYEKAIRNYPRINMDFLIAEIGSPLKENLTSVNKPTEGKNFDLYFRYLRELSEANEALQDRVADLEKQIEELREGLKLVSQKV